jgi:hypothetical protein
MLIVFYRIFKKNLVGQATTLQNIKIGTKTQSNLILSLFNKLCAYVPSACVPENYL